jgi:hypothetical protein
MQTKVILNPSVNVTDPHWLQLIAYIQLHPFCKLRELEFKDGKPFGAIEVQESIRF